MLLPNPTPEVQAYLTHQDNEAMFVDSDWYGRFVLPMDQVIFQYNTDEGVALLLTGYVKRIIALCAEVRVNIGFGISNKLIRVEHTIKLPANATTEHYLLRFITALNGEICYNNPSLHFNGRAVCFIG